MVIGLGLAENIVRMLVTAAALAGFSFAVHPNLTSLLGRDPTIQDFFAVYLAILLATLAVSTVLIRVLAARTEP